jgi:hypothetical protein
VGLLFAFWLFLFFFWPAVGLLFAIWLFLLFLFLARSELALCLQAFCFGFFCLFNLLVFGLKLGLGHARRAHAL